MDNNIVDHKVFLPTGKTAQMKDLAEQYIFVTGVLFMKLAFKRKKYDVGASDMLFFTITSNLAALYYKVSDQLPQYKLNLLDLLCYMNDSEKHSKYLDDIRHPAGKRSNEEYDKLRE